jgi:hypothetical protein
MSTNSKPGRRSPKTAIDVAPALSPGLRTVAASCDIERPRRSTVTSISTGPERTCAAKTVVTERKRCAGTPSSASIARSPTTATIPPCGSCSVHASRNVAR